MIYALIENNTTFIGFFTEKEKGKKYISLTEKEHTKLLEEQTRGNTIYFNIETKAMETIKLETFEYIDKNGEVKKDTETELKHYKDMLLILKKDRVQLKKDIRDFEEFEEDTTELKEQLRIKEKEITDIENIINDLEG